MMEAAGNALQWHPQFMKNRYDNWVQGLQWDWCISRQRHYGVPIPVWYCKKCDAVLLPDASQLPIDPITDKPPKTCSCGCTEFIPEKDILDTWATSSLTPQIAAKLVPEKYNALFPMTFRQNSHDIITFWLFNSVVKTQLHDRVNPWSDVMITGWVLDPKGKKMSKSKGNVIDPHAVWDQYSVDAQRYAAAGTKLGDDYPYQEKDVATGQKVVTKLWNASKFAFMHMEDYDGTLPSHLWVSDKMILRKCAYLIEKSTAHFNNYEYSKVKQDTEQFFLKLFCDNYLEMCKGRLYNPDVYGEEARKAAQYTLYHGLLTALKLFAPIMPYITEEIYGLYFKSREKNVSIHVSAWPTVKEALKELKDDDDVLAAGDLLVDVLATVRKWKSEQKLSLGADVKAVHISCSDERFTAHLSSIEDDLKIAARAADIVYDDNANISCSNEHIKIHIEKS